ncbi:MAG TPA: hypothetical protein VGM23_14955, partial [Armatimonadota bacterium]
MNRSFLHVTGLLCCLFAASAPWAAKTKTPPAKPVAPVVTEKPAPPPAPIVTNTYSIPIDHSGCQVNWMTGQFEVVGVGYDTEKTEIGKRQ